MRQKKEIDFEVASRLLEYNPETGEITWKVNRMGHAKAGDVAGSVSNYYRYIGICGRNILAHRLAWLLHYGKWPEGEIDHLNRIKTDNRISNLADVDRSKNMQNVNANGFYASKCGKKYTARIAVNKIVYHLGTYDTPEEAKAAYFSARKALKTHNSDFMNFYHDRQDVLPRSDGLCKANTSGYKNISIRSRGGIIKYEVCVKCRYIGKFNTIELALKARDEARKALSMEAA